MLKETRSTRMMVPPDKMPVPPIPAMTRPTMKALDVGAAAQTMDPSSKTLTRLMKIHFAGKKVLEMSAEGKPMV